MAEEGETQRSVVIDPLQTVFGGVGNLADGVGAQVGKLCRFHIAPRLFKRIELWSIPRQSLDGEPVALAGDPIRHAPAPMRRQPIPDQQHQAVHLMLMQFRQKSDQCFIVVGARTQRKDEVRIATVRLVDHSTSDGQPLPGKAVVEHWRLASGRPSRSDRRQQGDARLVLKHDQRVLAPSSFFSRGQRCVTQRSMASSSRSTARRAGRCQLQPSLSRKMYQMWPV